MDKEAFKARLAVLREKYVFSLPGRLAEIRNGLNAQRSSNDPQLWIDLHRQAHTLIGSAGTFGLDDLSDAARALEIPLRAIMENRQTTPDFHQLDDLLQALVEHAAVPSSDQFPASKPTSRITLEPAPQPASTPPPLRTGARIGLYCQTCHAPANLTNGLADFGFDTTVFPTCAELLNSANAGGWSAMILFAGPERADPELLEVIQAIHRLTSPPVTILISGDASLTARLDAAKAGADVFEEAPADLNRLMDRLGRREFALGGAPFSVFIVDDDPDSAEVHAEILRNAGMTVRIASDPLTALPLMQEHPPDLILLDLNMPGCTGLDLALVIRQFEDFLSVPIVFLSGEQTQSRQLAALDIGGDDFLTKPIAPARLVVAVGSRIRRYRQIRGLMAHDGLTGLLNHTSFKTRLETEIQRCSRMRGQTALAILDLDNFKTVNDTYGHQAGDLALKALSRLLVLRLRRADSIGRLGGEEFGVIMPDTDINGALIAMNDIRESFSRRIHNFAGQSFRITLSCGLAVYPACRDAASLTKTADDALYEAKHQGRNKVVASPA